MGLTDIFMTRHRAVVGWTIARLPAPGARGSLAGQFGSWIYQQATQELDRLWR